LLLIGTYVFKVYNNYFYKLNGHQDESMFGLLKSENLPNIREFPLEAYSIKFSLDRLVLGVDNIRYDVHLSPSFCMAGKKVVIQLFARYSRIGEMPGMDSSAVWNKEREEFKLLCRHILVEAVNQAKLKAEVEIDFLAQTAVIKWLIDEVRNQYETMVESLKNNLRKCELSYHQDLREIIRLKEELSGVEKRKRSILLNVGKDLFRYFIDVQFSDLKDMREANFGAQAALPRDVFSNPLLHLKNLGDDLFMTEEYVLLGHRFEDLNAYNSLILLIKTLLGEIGMMHRSEQDLAGEPVPILYEKEEVLEKEQKDNLDREIDAWIKDARNVDILFNYFQSKDRYKRLKKQKRAGQDLIDLKKQAGDQRQLLNFFYERFQKRGILKNIVASYEMRPVYQNYCPPLSPHQILQFLIARKERRQIIGRIRRLKGFYGKSFSLTPLRKSIKRIKKIGKKKKEEYLIQYLKDFCRYHKDLGNFNMLKEGMERVNLLSEEKIINLSRANRVLYEFLLPHEQAPEEKPIINHVIIKADVRGSTDLTHQMEKKELTPASYFSLNFFEPITNILYEYGANKVFIEGDAVILSIFEHKDTPDQWYSVARACGLAIQMLFIVKRYNITNQMSQLPKLELGIGITYFNNAPSFLFDGDNRIMISPAINLADRLSGCAMSARKLLADANKPFNLYVFQTASDKDVAATIDDLSLRYNLDGIELSAAGFEKLSQEIELKAMRCFIPDLQKEKIMIYTGKFPTLTGKFNRLIIREDQIQKVVPENLRVISPTSRKYYEVCTHPTLYKYVKENV